MIVVMLMMVIVMLMIVVMFLVIMVVMMRGLMARVTSVNNDHSNASHCVHLLLSVCLYLTCSCLSSTTANLIQDHKGHFVPWGEVFPVTMFSYSEKNHRPRTSDSLTLLSKLLQSYRQEQTKQYCRLLSSSSDVAHSWHTC